MATATLNRVLRHLQRGTLDGAGEEQSDGQLLERFFSRQDELAFEILVQRHGPMVLGVCGRLLRNPHDAEDAFQAVFLVLVHKGMTLRSHETIGNWLYGVAHHMALKARAATMKRRTKESQAKTSGATEAVTADELLDLQPILDQELSRLPDRYREAVVLCELQCRPRKEVARQLGIPEGILSSRLATARRMLARRFTRRGLTLSVGMLAALRPGSAGAAGLPPQLVTHTVQAAGLFATGASATGASSAHVITLTEGVLKTMFLTKVKTMASCLAAFCFLAGALTLGWSNLGTAEAHARQPAAQDRDKPQLPDKDKPAPKKDPTKVADPTRDKGKKEEKKDAAAPITRVHLKSGKAIIRQTGKESHEAKGNPLFVQLAKAEVNNGTLHLEGPPGVEFVVEVKDLSELTVEGIGIVEVKDLKTKRLEVTVKVSGQALVTGTAEEQVINVSGVGRFHGEDCKGKQGKVQVDAGGSAIVNVSDKLQVKIQGVGRVNYLGTPSVEKDVAFGGHLAQGPPANVGGFGGQGFPGFRGFHPMMEQRLGAHVELPNAILIDQLNLPEKQGMVLREVNKDSAADRAGLKTNDVLLELDGKPVPSSPDTFRKLLSGIKADQKVAAVVLRKGKKVTVKDLTLPEARDVPGFRIPQIPMVPLPPIPPIPPGNVPGALPLP